MILEAAVPAGELGRAVKSSNRLQNAVDTIDNAGHLRTAARYTARAADNARAPARYAGTQLTRGLAASKSIGEDVAGRLLAGARTAGQTVQWARHANELRPQSARAVADGGPDFRRAVYRAADSDALDSYAQLDRALRGTRPRGHEGPVFEAFTELRDRDDHGTAPVGVEKLSVLDGSGGPRSVPASRPDRRSVATPTVRSVGPVD